jgi:hypothetical protein
MIKRLTHSSAWVTSPLLPLRYRGICALGAWIGNAARMTPSFFTLVVAAWGQDYPIYAADWF